MAKLTLCIAIFAAVIVASLMAAPQHDEPYQDHEDLQIDEIEAEQWLSGYAIAAWWRNLREAWRRG